MSDKYVSNFTFYHGQHRIDQIISENPDKNIKRITPISAIGQKVTSNGYIFLCKMETNDDSVKNIILKICSYDNCYRGEEEVKYSKMMADLNIGPQIILSKVFKFNNGSCSTFIFMERYDMNVKDFIESQSKENNFIVLQKTLDLINQMVDHKIYFFDIKLLNTIVCTSNLDVKLIDFDALYMFPIEFFDNNQEFIPVFKSIMTTQCLLISLNPKFLNDKDIILLKSKTIDIYNKFHKENKVLDFILSALYYDEAFRFHFIPKLIDLFVRYTNRHISTEVFNDFVNKINEYNTINDNDKNYINGIMKL